MRLIVTIAVLTPWLSWTTIVDSVHLPPLTVQAKQEETAEAAAKGESPAADADKAAEGEQPKELSVKKDEDAVESVKKMIAAQRGEFGEEERKGQKEITLADELEGPVK